MPRRQQARARPIVLEYEAETALEKAIVRMAQASRPTPDDFFALRAGAVVFQVAGVALLAIGVFGGLVLASSDLEGSLGFPPVYLSVVAIVASALGALLLLVLGELLLLLVAVSRNTKLTSVLLAEMNFADRSEHTRGVRDATR